MGRQSDEALQLADADELVNYLMGAHCAYMQWRELTYYLTDANDIYWREDRGAGYACSRCLAGVVRGECLLPPLSVRCFVLSWLA